VIPIGGLDSRTALGVIDATRDKQDTLLRNDPTNKRGEAAFRERIAQITTPEELVADYEVYSFVMRAFDLEDQIFGKGMIRRVLESDPVAPESLLNRLTDSRFREMHLSLGFTTEEGPQVPDFSDPAFVEGIVDRFYNRAFISTNADQNETVGTVLEFRDGYAGINSWFDVLKDKTLTNFFQVALNLPSQMSGLDLDQQKRMLEEKFDLADLADPAARERLVTRYIAISDATTGLSAQTNTAVNLLSIAASGGQFVPFTFDLALINYRPSQIYR
jgi:hypothetical protein